ncbi:histidine kinase (plasmid) [Burkholderia sp. SFA1]|uniref:ATP-binding protein n=1 Tax=unclassified Caballeronia TaxID=2646786 RepID=UPI001F2597B8|nr:MULTISPECIES: ATP-binding protein [unclassified Caballeronia]MCE4547342.1 ATP-binding protein [Caballeronia sp. PC1]MCE4575326.1 ATP-binding protein [Caballeronia sp. CLC5]BBQ02325.1 histidine kinase [Burkholderia sp. SFA1]
MAEPEPSFTWAIIFAPRGRDGLLAANLLRDADIPSVVCHTFGEFEGAIGDHASFAVVTEEALRHADMRRVHAWVLAQQSWSDFPFILLTQHGGRPEHNPAANELLEILHNVTFLERPFHPTTFLSVARTALRERLRQYEARARIDELRLLNDSLEERVKARTAQLEEANRLMFEEMEQRQRTEDLLRQAQKMEVMGQLTGGVAHDFNNLLMAIISNLELLSKRVGDTGSRRLVANALQGAERGSALTQRLLAFARRQELDVKPRELVALLRGMADLIVRAAGSNIELALRLPSSLPPVLIDANQVELGILNLVVNARDAMLGGGKLSIVAELVSLDHDIELRPGTYARLAVIDSGTGMDPQTLARAREPFFSTKELGKGTGLGLSMVHGLAMQLHGTLRLHSKPGAGTTAEILLPVAADVHSVPLRQETSSRRAEARTAPLTVLLVDDDPLILDSTAFLLEDMGHRVVPTSSADAAMTELADDASIDIIVTDYSMPGKTGAQLAELAQKLRPRIPVLITSGYAELPVGDEERWPRLNKPYQQHQLSSALARLLMEASGVDRRAHTGDQPVSR